MGAKLVELPTHEDYRGNLTVIEDDAVPFPVRRRFFIWDVPWRESRADHANRECHQLLWCVGGGVTVEADGEEFYLYSPRIALYVPPLTWLALRFTSGAGLVVLASRPYDPEDQIRDYDEFLREKGEIGENQG
jgi:UDP-2-acetamido-3-amino-2,3-dideoxy-glucuronate N-acetyltransferase